MQIVIQSSLFSNTDTHTLPCVLFYSLLSKRQIIDLCLPFKSELLHYSDRVFSVYADSLKTEGWSSNLICDKYISYQKLSELLKSGSGFKVL